MAENIQWFAIPPQGQVPIAFLPVRIETRFGSAADGSPELWVRVFPDDVHVDSFEPALTAAESAARTAFLANPTQAAWVALAGQFGALRAAWIASDGGASSGSKASDWTTAATTGLLPDRFIVCAFDDTGAVTRQAGADIAGGLALGPSPSGGNPSTDPALAWMRDFNQAIAAGLGIRIPIAQNAAKSGFQRVLVLGVKSKLDPVASATTLATVLDAHHYTDGLELLPIGTPTNNSDGIKSGYTTSDPGYTVSFAIERGQPMTPSPDGRGNGDRVARALGVAPSNFAHVGGADGRHDDAPMAMNTLLWPATFEYYLTNLVNGAVPDPANLVPAARDFFVNWVRARGPWPTLRIGRQPYGIVPVTLSATYQPHEGDTISAPLLSLLQSLRPTWQSASTRVPRVGLGTDPDATLVSVLGMSPRSGTFVGRSVLGPQYNEYYWRFLAKPIDAAWWTRLGELATSNLRTLATAAAPTRLGNSTYLGKHFNLSDDLVDATLTNAPLATNYLTTFGGMTLAQLKSATPSGRPVPLLWLLARHAALRQYASTAYSLLGSAVSAADQIEPELIDISPAHSAISHIPPTVWDHLALIVPGGSAGTGAVSDYLDQHKADGPAPFVAFWKALASLATLTVTNLDQVLRETLDLHSHRLDAWYTAVASARLDALRQIKGNESTLYIGAYGWVDNVRPQPSPTSWGFVHAPSPAHAATSAVLRSAYLTHQQSGSGAAAVDLSSTRVRLSQNLLDGVRSGQALGALLGYQLERALHNVTLDPFIAPLRAFAPIEGVTGDRTIDGLTLLDQRSSIPWGMNGLPALGSTPQHSIDAQISILADTVDAVSDLMLAESVHQLVGGNALRAGATVDAIGRGDTPPPVLDITRTPRRGGIVTHRLLATLGGGVPSGWTTTPRSQAEPRLAAFAANILGAPARVLAGAQIVQPNGTVAAIVAMTLTDLALGPLDVLSLSASELAARFSRVAWSRRPSSTAVGSTVALNFARDPAWTSDKLSVNELMTVATSVSTLIAGARAATAADFATPSQAVDAAIDTTELKSRADAAVVALNTALGHFTDNTATDTALIDAAAFGVPNSVPLLEVTAWPVQTAAAHTELQSRSAQIATLEASFDRTGASETALRDHDIARLQVVFGAGFQVAAALTAAFAGTLPALFGSSETLLADQPLAPVTWLARSARVRAGVARLSEAMLYGEALSSSPPLSPIVAQLPVLAGDVWAGLPLKSGAASADCLSLVAVGALQGATAALVIDEWTETVPNATETTGLTFNVNDPTARAPQAILLGVQPDTSPSWTIESVEGTLLDAIDLAQLRAVDPDSLGDVGHFLPALVFPINLGNTSPDTISTDLTLAAPYHRIIRPPPLRPGNPASQER
jgi:hypothetical protein